MTDASDPRSMGHCFRCRTRKAMIDPTETRLRNGRMAVSGPCVTCGARIYRLVSSTAVPPETGTLDVPEARTP